MSFFILVTLLSQLSFANSTQLKCDNYRPPAKYLAAQEKVKSYIKNFSNDPVIAGQADTTLSKLLKANSPVIQSWLKKRQLDTKNTEAVVFAWREYYATHFVLANYKLGNKEMDAKVELLVHEIHKLFADGTFRKRMERLFEKTKKTAIATIKNWYLGNTNTKNVINRITTMKLYWLKSFKDSKFAKKPLEYTNWGIAYDPVPNEINMGFRSLAYPNDETYLAVFAHEIAHSFDSCRWGAFFNGPWPFKRVGECLRSSDSVGAKKRDDSQLLEMVKEKKLSHEMSLALRKNPTCNKSIYPPIGVQKDQLPEAFADWFSAEVIANMDIKVTLNMRSDLCEETKLNPGSAYLPNPMRLRKIYYSQPKFSEFLRLKIIKYCSM